MIRRRWLLVMLDVVFLVALGGYVFAGLEDVPFHGDESSFIYISEDYHTLFYEHDWSDIRVRGNLWRTREQYLRTMNGSVATYTIGLAWDLAGYSVDDLNGSWRWSDEIDYAVDQWVYNLAQGNRPSNGLLTAARVPSTLFTALSIVLLFVIARTLTGSRLAGWVAGLVYTTTPAILLNGRRAMQEGPLLFALLLVILIAIRVIRAQTDGAMTWRRRAAWYLALGAASGFAMASKHTSAVIIAAAFLSVGALPRLRGYLKTSPPGPLSLHREGEKALTEAPSPRVERGFRGEVNHQQDTAFMRRHYYTLAAALLVAWLVMIALLPVWWSLPVLIMLAAMSGLALVIGFERQRAVRWALVTVVFLTWLAQPMAGYDLIATPVKMVVARAYLMHKQAKDMYHQTSLSERASTLVDQAFFAGPQYFEDPLWVNFDPITVEIAAYEHAHLGGRGGGVMWGLLLVALDGLGAWWLYAHRQQGIPLLIACWLVIPALSLLVNPLGWQRYYIILTAPLSLMAGMGALVLADRWQSQRPRVPERLPSKPPLT